MTGELWRIASDGVNGGMIAAMCGIGGIVSFDPDRPVRRSALEAIAAAVAHRGPDGQSIWQSDVAGFAFRRLAVLDPDPRAMQPMTSPDGRYTIAFNGEIYNFRELKKQLPDRPWRTTGDTEVLLAALAEWGPAGLSRLSGMFAIALWDSAERTLLLARDRMGQKPLYFAADLASIAFASELPALHAWAGWDQSIDDRALTSYLRFSCVGAPHTIYRGARQLQPGTYLVIDEYSIGKALADRLDETSEPPGNDPLKRTIRGAGQGAKWFDCNAIEAKTTTDARTVIEGAVAEQLVSDVPLGVFLSGGIDSSIMTLCARRRGPVQTFSIGFDDRRYDESGYAREVAKHLGTEHHEFRVTPDAAAELPKLAALFGEPFGDSSALPMNDLARETRKHVTVALSGDGGDELFGGYDRYRAMALNLRPLRPLAPLGGRLARGHPKNPITRIGRLLRASKLGDGERYRQIAGLFDDTQIISLRADAPGVSPLQNQCDYLTRWHALRRTRSASETALAIDRVTYLPNDLLTKVDRCSMRHALEVRSPFMDAGVVRMAAGLKAADLFRGGKKRLLREAFAADLPASVFGRKKMGFAVPIGDWFRTSLRPMLRDNILSPGGFCANHFDRRYIQQMADDHHSGRVDHSQRLYALLMLELWWQTKSAAARPS